MLQSWRSQSFTRQNNVMISVDMNKVADINTVAVSEISKSFDNTLVVDNISFNVGPGEIFGLIGPFYDFTEAERLGRDEGGSSLRTLNAAMTSSSFSKAGEDSGGKNH